MGTSTAIAWTDHTFQPWMGCSHVSPGCDNCYAETLGKRTGRVQWGDQAERVTMSEGYWRNPTKWNRQAEAEGQPHLVFCASMADVFEDRPELVPLRARLVDVIAGTPELIWLLLTKRPENVMALIPVEWCGRWPDNVWIGTTVEDQERADERIPVLAEIPAPVRFLSCEPLLGAVDLSPWLGLEWMDALGDAGAPFSFRGEGGWGREMFATVAGHVPPIHWVIAGGESGPGHRPLNFDHARDLRDQCRAAEVPYFFKQVGGAYATSGGDELDGEVLKAFPVEARRDG